MWSVLPDIILSTENDQCIFRYIRSLGHSSCLMDFLTGFLRNTFLIPPLTVHESQSSKFVNTAFIEFTKVRRRMLRSQTVLSSRTQSS